MPKRRVQQHNVQNALMGLVQQRVVLMVHVQQRLAALVAAVAIMYQTYVLMVHVT